MTKTTRIQGAEHRFPKTKVYRGRELNPNIFFSNFSGASGISRQNPGISRQKSLIPWLSRDIPNFLAPPHSRGKPPAHQKISGLKSLGLSSFFVPRFRKTREKWGTGGILFREYCFGGENSLSSATNSVSSARNSVSSHLHTNNRLKGTH